MSDTSIELLRNMPVFGGLKATTLQRILDNSLLCSKPASEYFFRENDRADSMFVIRSGEVVIEKIWNERPVQMHRLHKGDCFGEMALIDLQTRSAAVRAESECEAIEISLKMLHDLYQRDLEEYAIIMMNMGREVSRRLRKTSERLFELEQRN